VAINKTQGKMNREATWAAPEARQVLSVGAKRLYVRLSDNTIGALDKQTGQIVWRGSRKYASFTTNLQDSTIFLATESGEVYAYRPAGEAAATRPVVTPKAAPAAMTAPATPRSATSVPTVKAAP
jgi:outer membrane protein assembly factor BamB